MYQALITHAKFHQRRSNGSGGIRGETNLVKVAAVGEKNHKCLFTDSLHRLDSRFARTSSVSLEMIEYFEINLTFLKFLRAVMFSKL